MDIYGESQLDDPVRQRRYRIMNQMRLAYALVVAVAALTAIPAVARAADYHHVHVTASNATEAVKWYTE